MLAILALPSIAPALARAANQDDYHALTHTLVQARCYMNTCQWFSFESVEPVAKDNRRSLFLLIQKDWSSDYPDAKHNRKRPRTYDGTHKIYVVCSRRDPALIIGSDEDGWSEEKLTPGARKGIYGAAESGHAIYWAACHGVSVKDVYAAAARGARLGYSTSAPSFPAPDVKLGKPIDVMTER